jgi:uncharacterized membrane protein YkvI
MSPGRPSAEGGTSVHPHGSWFQRLLLPGLAFKAVVIGGGYATGRELAEFFLPCGPRGGLLAIGVATAIWSTVCALTFLFAHTTESLDYRSFFRQLLGPLWPVFEIAYLAVIVIVLSVYGAAAGEIVRAQLALPPYIGTLILVGGIALTVWHGNDSVERVFKYVSFLLYGVFIAFFILCLMRFWPAINRSFQAPAAGVANWFDEGLNYAVYNVIGATAILPVLRHVGSRRDAAVAGLLCGPLAMFPALFFFVCMTAFYPQILHATLPSDWMLSELGIPAFRITFQLMILSGLLESGAGCLNAIIQRVASSYASAHRPFPPSRRLALSLVLMSSVIFLADRIGLVALIAKGFRAISALFLVIYLLPLLTYGVWRMAFRPQRGSMCGGDTVRADPRDVSGMCDTPTK